MNTLSIIKNNQQNVIYGVSSDCLKFIAGNRGTNLTHVLNISKAMVEGSYIPPIVVNELDLCVIDGQHRYEAAKRLWKDGIDYTLEVILVDFENPLLAAIKYNSNAKKWTTENYVTAYMKDGRESYHKLHTFCNEHSLCIVKDSIGTRLRYRNACELILRKAAKLDKGTLKITDEQIEDAKVIYKELSRIVEATKSVRVFTRGILAYLAERDYILSKCSFSEYISKLKDFKEPSSDKRIDWQDAFTAALRKR